jgi:hypothetical protein
MADPRAFISFDFDHDEAEKNLFAGQCSKKSPTPFTAQDWSSKEKLPEKEWEKLIEAKIGSCNMMFVLVSPTAYSAHGVKKEIAMAQRKNVPFYGVYIKGAGATTSLPDGLARNRCIKWDWNLIAAAVRQMMKEGKNK